MNAKLILLLLFYLLITPKLIFAHDGGHKEEKHTAPLTEKTTPLDDSIYYVGGGEDTELPLIEGLSGAVFSVSECVFFSSA